MTFLFFNEMKDFSQFEYFLTFSDRYKLNVAISNR